MSAITITDSATRSYLIEQDPSISFNSVEQKTYILEPTLMDVNSTNLVAASKELTNIHFNAVISGILDPTVTIRFPELEFCVNHTSIGGAADGILPIATFAQLMSVFNNFDSIAFAQMPLMHLIANTIQIRLNGENIGSNTQPAKIIDYLIKYSETNKNDLFPGYDLGYPDLMETHDSWNRLSGGVYAPYISEKGPIAPASLYDSRTPFLSSLNTAVTNSTNARKMTVGIGQASTAGKCYFKVYDLAIFLPLSVFSTNIIGSKSLYGINSLEVDFSFDLNAVDKAFAFLATPNVTATTIRGVNITSMGLTAPVPPVLQYTQRSVNPVLHNDTKQSDGFTKPYEMTFKDIQQYSTVTKTIPSLVADAFEYVPINIPILQLSSLPEKLLICGRKISSQKKAGVLKYGFASKVGCYVTQLIVKIAGMNSMIITGEQITLMNARNGIGSKVGYFDQKYTHGNSYICIDLLRDLGVNGSVELLNTQTSLSLEIVMSVSSLNKDSAVYNEDYEFTSYGVTTKILSQFQGNFKTQSIVSVLPNSPLSAYIRNADGSTKHRRYNPLIYGGRSGGIGIGFGDILSGIGRVAMNNGPQALKLIQDSIKSFKGGRQYSTSGVIGGNSKQGKMKVEKFAGAPLGNFM